MDALRDELRTFAEDRDWGQFHDPKNLAMALIVEAGELVELFQWLTPDEASLAMEDPTLASRVREEAADVFAYLIRFADVAGVDLESALREKIAMNAERYPVEEFRGSARKAQRKK